MFANQAFVVAVALRMLICFALGSIPFAVLAMAGSGIDIRRVGSGNPGFNNVLRVSKPRAVIALIGDVGKGVLAVLLATRWWPAYGESGVVLAWLFGFAAVLGHCYSPFLKFNGGKGIATSGGVMLVLYPLLALPAMLFFLVVRLTGSHFKWSERGMMASISSWVVFAVLMLLFRTPGEAAFAACMTAFLAWRHRKNFQNLMGASARPQAAG